jgi:TIR domain-containing protein
MPTVFISSAASDEGFVQRLSANLESSGIDTTSLAASVSPGDAIADAVTRGIDSADAFIVVLSPRSEKSQWVSTEVAMALATEQRKNRFRVYPVLADSDTELPFFLRDRVYLDMSTIGRFQDALPKLVEAIKAPPKALGNTQESLRRRLEALEIEHASLSAAEELHRASVTERSRLLVSAIASVTIVVGTISTLIVFRGSWTDWLHKAELGWSALAVVASLVTSLISNFVFRRIDRESKTERTR